MKDIEIEKLWDELEDVPIDENECIDIDWHGWEPIYEDGKVVIDSSIAEELLPCRAGFFFGGCDYDEYYVNDIGDSIKILENVLATTDFETQAIYYMSSW